AALGLSAALVIAGARQAGEIVGGQGGVSAAALLDPGAGGGLAPAGGPGGPGRPGGVPGPRRPPGPGRGLGGGRAADPAGGPDLSADVADLAFGRVGQALELALRAAAPAALALAAAGLALALLQRAAPGLGLLGLTLPARTALGLLLVLLGLATLAATLAT